MYTYVKLTENIIIFFQKQILKKKSVSTFILSVTRFSGGLAAGGARRGAGAGAPPAGLGGAAAGGGDLRQF